RLVRVRTDISPRIIVRKAVSFARLDGESGKTTQEFEHYAPTTSESTFRVQIPTQAGRVFRFEAGRRSDLMPASIPD
uniref:hypothetical protein n=1 Tax=Raoultella ornithinolytica TaxID=54291 RepID=UPI001954D46C